MNCPVCGHPIQPNMWGLKSFDQIKSATANCPVKDCLLLIQGGQVKGFHATLHQEDPSWPKDGQGTGYIEL
jgi:hypothetical protein